MTQYHVIQRHQEDYQRSFAASLVQSLGVQEAINACHENHWYGVLRHIQNQKN